MTARFAFFVGIIALVFVFGPARFGSSLQSWFTNRVPDPGATSSSNTASSTRPSFVFERPASGAYALALEHQASASRWDVTVSGNHAQGLFTHASSSYEAYGAWNASTTALALTAYDAHGLAMATATATWEGKTVTAEQRLPEDGTSPLMLAEPASGAARVSYVRAVGAWEDAPRSMSCHYDATLPVIEAGKGITLQAADRMNTELRRLVTDDVRRLEQAKDGFLRTCRTDLEAERASWKDAGDPGGMFQRDVSVRVATLVNTDPWISFQIDRYTYTGGAHGNTARIGATFDRRTGERVSLETALSVTPAAVPEVVAEGVRRLLAQQRADSWLFEASEERMRAFVKASPAQRAELWRGGDVGFSTSTTFVLVPHGVKLIFQQYEIAPYAAGILEVTVPSSAFDSFRSVL